MGKCGSVVGAFLISPLVDEVCAHGGTYMSRYIVTVWMSHNEHKTYAYTAQKRRYFYKLYFSGFYK